MPVGMQLIGPRFSEQTLLNAGLAFEQASGLKNIIAALRGEEDKHEIQKLSSV